MVNVQSASLNLSAPRVVVIWRTNRNNLSLNPVSAFIAIETYKPNLEHIFRELRNLFISQSSIPIIIAIMDAHHDVSAFDRMWRHLPH